MVRAAFCFWYFYIFPPTQLTPTITYRSPFLSIKYLSAIFGGKDIEFYGTIHISSANLGKLLAEWAHYHNWDRPHSAHKEKKPTERCCELMAQTPLSRELADAYFPEKEDIREQNYRLDSNSNIETLSMNHANPVQSSPGCHVGSPPADVNYN